MMMVMMTGEYFKDEMKEMQKNNENHGGKWKIRNSNTALGSGAGLAAAHEGGVVFLTL